MRIAQEEIFGPTTALIPVADFDEAIRVANGIEYGLSSSIFTRDVNRAFRAMRDLETGITYINAGTTGAEVHLPFGGTKNTGNGHREAGQAALDVFTEWKSLYIDFSGRLQRAQIDNAELTRVDEAINLAEKLASFDEAFQPTHRRVLQRQQDPGGEDARRVRVALASRRRTTSSSSSPAG